MVNKIIKFVNILILGISIIVSIIIPIQLLYLSKILAVFILISALILLVLSILTVKTKSNVQIWLSSFSVILLFIFVMDNGLFYRVNADIVYQDKDVFIVDKNEPTAIMSCGTVFTLFVKKYWGFRGYEIIPNKYCFTELPEIELNPLSRNSEALLL